MLDKKQKTKRRAKMIAINDAERRLHPRIDHNLPVNIVANGYDFSTTSHNVSCAGTYCTVAKYIPPFTRLAVKLSLPIEVKNKKSNLNIECKGVVVRTEDAKEGGFNIAIFFNGINEEQKNKIARYVKQFLPK